MHHLQLDFNAGSAQTPILRLCRQLEHQLCVRSFWNIQIMATCGKKVLSPSCETAIPWEVPNHKQ